MRARIAGPLVVAVALMAGTAIAAPDRTVELSSSTTQHAWDGEAVQATNFSLAPVVAFDPNACSKESDSYCEQILLNVRSGAPVKLDATLTGFTDPSADFDLYIYKSDASGKVGEEVDGGSGTGGTFGEDEIWTAEEVEPGYYLLVVVHFYNPEASYKGLAKVTGATAVAGGTTPPPGTTAPPPGGTTPPPSGGGFATLPFKAPGTIGSAKKAKKKKSISFKATAQADISNLVVGLLNRNKKVIATAKVASFPKGTATIRLKVRKLKKGSYTLASQGTVNGQTLKTAQAVKIKK